MNALEAEVEAHRQSHNQSEAAQRGLQNILVVRLGAMGDILHSLPAVAMLRRAFPKARIDWVVEERWVELLCSRPDLRSAPLCSEKPLIDTVHVVDTRTWRKAMLARTTRISAGSALAALRATHYDAAFDLQGNIKSAVAMRLARAPVRYGFAHPREAPAAMLYTRRVAATSRHVVEQNCEVVAAALPSAGSSSVRSRPSVAEFPLPVDARLNAWAEQELARRHLKAFALISPGAGWGAKCWPAERFGAVARALAEDGIGALVNHGPGETRRAEAVVAASGGAAQAISCSVGELLALTRRARLFVGGDTGPTHLAAALGVPVVGIYGPTDPARNGPYGSPCQVLRSEKSVTSHARRAEPEAGMLEITAEAAITAARKLLREVPCG